MVITMNCFLLLALTAGLLSPTVANTEPIPKISDFEISLAEPWRLDLICPFKKETVFEDGQRKTKKLVYTKNVGLISTKIRWM